MPSAGSALLLDEYFEAEDPRFLDELFVLTRGKTLKSFAERLYGDSRPFSRSVLLRYIDDGCDRPHHQPIVKALFKLAELAEDDELMGHFLVAFDRFRRDSTVPEHAPGSVGKGAHLPLFSRSTRRYLCRRAFRYFRQLAHRDPSRYGHAVRGLLPHYEDTHLERPEQLLASWGLLHILYWGSPVLDRAPTGIRVTYHRSLAELEPAPYCPSAFANCLDALLELASTAKSRVVRVFCLTLLRRDYDLSHARIPIAQLRALLRSPDTEIQDFAAELFRRSDALHHLRVDEWLELLRIESPAALSVVCELFAKHVSPERLTLGQCIDLACARAAPVADLGLGWARQKSIRRGADLAELTRLARAESERARGEGVEWLLTELERHNAPPEALRELFDSRFAEVRARALAFFAQSPRFRTQTLLWAALSESPYDDARAFLLRHLETQKAHLAADALERVWITTLCAVHRGSRDKRAALRQIAERIARRPGEAPRLVPLLAIALRSVRPPERSAALAAVALAAKREPELRTALAVDLPELRFLRLEAV